MEVKANSEQNTDKNKSTEQQIGEFLRHERVAQKKSLADVAKELRISEKQLIALESDDYKSLPEAPFLKGHYRNYAEILNVDISAMLARFDNVYKQATGQRATHDLANSPIKEMGRLASSGKATSKWIKRGLIAAAVIVVLALLGTGISKMMSKKSSNAQENEQVIDINQPQATTSNAPVATKQGDSLHLEFSNPTSVMIKDADGNVLAQGRQASNLDVSGKAPFDIRIDDAKSAKLKLNNEDINLSSHTNSSGSAEFKIAP